MRVVIVCVLAALILTPAFLCAYPTVTIYTDADSYQSGDTIEISLSASNFGDPTSVAVYIGLLTPEGWIYTLSPYGMSGWSDQIEAWIPEIYVPGSFNMDPTPVLWVDLPSSMPPILQACTYNFASVLTYPGTFEWVCDATFAPFAYAPASTDITMVSIPAGSFLMGSPSDESGRDSDEGPQRTVNISAFQMSETEVTEKQWEEVMGWNDCYYERGDNYPVEYVTWYDCVSFCNELSEAYGYTKCYTISNVYYDGNHIEDADVTCNFGANGYRLPTEAEWEYACRARTTTRFYTGDSDSDLGRAGWYDGNSGSQKREVAQKDANAWGLYDMHGDVYEWCWDWYSSRHYGTRPDPDSDPTGPSSGSLRVMRGGCWYCYAQYCRSANRGIFRPGDRYDYLGLRLVRSVN